MAQKQVLLDVKINLKEALKEIAEMKLKQNELMQQEKEHKAVIKELETAIAEQTKNGVQASEAQVKALADERQALVLAEERRKALGREIGEQSRKVQNTIVAEEKYKGTLKGLCAQLSIAKDELRAMRVEDPGYAEKAEEVGLLNERIKEMEASYGVYSRNVGNYGMAVQSTKDEINACVAKLAELTAAGQENSKEFSKAKAELEGFNKTMQDGEKDTLDFAQQGVGAAIGAMMLLSSVFGEDSAEGKELASTMKTMQIAVVAIATASQIYNAIQKGGLVTKIANNLQVKAGAAALRIEAKARVQATGATVAQTVAQKALNATMKANPILLIISAVIALGAAIFGLVKLINTNTSAQRKATEASLELEKQTRKTSDEIARQDSILTMSTANLSLSYQKELKELQKNFATKEQIAAKEVEFAAAIRKAERDRNREVLEAQRKEYEAAKANYEAQSALLAQLNARKGENNKKTKEQAEKASEAYQKMMDLHSSINNAVKAINDSIFEDTKALYDKQIEQAEKAYDRAMRHFQSRTAIEEEIRKNRATYLYDDTKTAEENAEEQWRVQIMYEMKLFKYQQKRQAESLALQRKNNKITQQEYEDALALMDEQSRNFALSQSETIKAHFRELTNAAIELAGGKMLDAQLSDLKAKYKAAEEAIKNDATLSADEKAYYLNALAHKSAEDEREIRLQYNDTTNSEILRKLEETYKYDLRQWSSVESERLEMEIEQQKKLISEKKKKGLIVFTEEADLAQKESQLRAALADERLIQSWKNADEQYRLHKEYLEKELEAENLSAIQRATLEQELADLVVDNNQRKLDSVQNYASQSMQMLDEFNNLLNALNEKEIADYEAKNNEEKASLEKRLSSGLISQKKYDREVAALDADLDKKKAEITKKQAIRDKTLSAMKIVLDTASAIMRIWADVPKVDFGVSTGVLTGIAAGIGAAQLAAVLAAPIPQAREGGIVRGPKHEGGGVLINTEGDERIVSAKASKAFPELLNLISYIGKHSAVPDTGYAARSAQSSNSTPHSESIDIELLADRIGAKVSDNIKSLKFYASITEIREADKLYTEIENSAKI